MAKDPAFLFYSSDFLTGTMFMTNEQIGIYIKLLCSQHQHGGIIDKTSFNTLVGSHEILRRKFTEVDEGFYNERLMEEMEKRSQKSSNISKAVKATWKKRRGKDGIPLKSQKKTKAILKGIENENENENENINEKEIEIIYPFDSEKFVTIWKVWKKFKSEQFNFKYKPIGEQGALKNLSSLSNGNEEYAIKIINQSIENGWKGFFKLKNNGEQTTKTREETRRELVEAIQKRAAERGGSIFEE